MVTFGYLIGELVRRISGKNIGTFFRDEIATPLGADFHIGLAPEHDARVAELIPPPPMEPPPIDPDSIARVGSLLACRGELNGVRLLSQATIDQAIEEQFNGIDLVLGVPVRWGLGFGLSNAKLAYLNPRVFYWGGFGGSWLEMDPDAGMCFSYEPA